MRPRRTLVARLLRSFFWQIRPRSFCARSTHDSAARFAGTASPALLSQQAAPGSASACADARGRGWSGGCVVVRGLSPSDERMYSRVNKLLQPGQLREFVEGHGGWSSLGPMPRRLPLRRQALPVPRQQQQQQQQHKQAVVKNQGRAPDLGNCPHLQ